MDKKTLIEKVRKLFRLAGNNPNEDEAMLAMAKAKSLMAEHNLHVAEVDAEEEKEGKKKQGEKAQAGDAYVKEGRGKYNRFDWGIAMATANLSETFVYLRRDADEVYGYRSAFRFIGHQTDVELAKAVFPVLLKMGRKLGRAWGKACGKSGGEVQRFKEAFAYRLAERADHYENKFAKGTEKGEIVSLVVVGKKEAIKRYMKEEGLRLGRAKVGSARVRSPEATAPGRAAADRVNLNFRNSIGR